MVNNLLLSVPYFYTKCKWIIWFLLIATTTSCIVKKLDQSPYQSQQFYRNTFANINALQDRSSSNNIGEPVGIGWSKINITPTLASPIAGYGGRRNKKCDKILDSIFIKTFVFAQANTKAALVCADLLLFPMEVKQEIDKLLPTIDYQPYQIYFTATHSHSSLGGWGRRLLGRAIAGKYSKKLVQQLAIAVVKSIQLAQQQVSPATIGFETIATIGLVKNRLIENNHEIDSTLRLFKFCKPNASAALAVFSAHATCIPSSCRNLSGDYPAAFTLQMETTENIDLVAFAAGAVASHGPILNADTVITTRISQLSHGLYSAAHPVWDTMKTIPAAQLHSKYYPLYLRKPQLRISPKWVLAPWLFYTFLGNYPSGISVLKIGNILMVGMPCDFSGQLALPLYQQALQKGLHLVITSFNGGYMGYVTPDKYYQLNEYETKDMNLYGPENGAYFSEIISTIIAK